MHHPTSLIATIAAGFGLAFLLGFVMHKLRLLAILGCLIAGVIPYSPGFVVGLVFGLSFSVASAVVF